MVWTIAANRSSHLLLVVIKLNQFLCSARCTTNILLIACAVFCLQIDNVGTLGEELSSESGREPALGFYADESAIQADLQYLAEDGRAGRDIGSPGLEQAAQHIARSFAASGLKMDAFGRTPFQPFNINIGAAIGELAHNRLMLTPISPEDRSVAPTGEPLVAISCQLDQQFRPLAIGNSAQRIAELVFVGYGITAPEIGYDDYAGLDAKGKVVVMLRKEPPQFPKRLQVRDGKNSSHAYFQSKLKNAIQHGAVGVMIVNDLDSIRTSLGKLENRIADETKRLNKLNTQLEELPIEAVNSRETLRQRRETSANMIEELRRQIAVVEVGLLDINEAGDKPLVPEIPVVSLSRAVVSQIMRTACASTINEVQTQIDQLTRPMSLALRYRVDLETQLTPSSVSSKNVVGYLDGVGELANETVVIGAHYDHVGMGGVGSLAPGTVAIHNGADDNASGTSALLSAARVMAKRMQNVPNHRRIVFIAFTGEERGLLGSEHYVRHPRWPLDSTIAMLNLDMVGRLRDNDLTVYGTGSATELDDILERANGRTQFKLFKVASGYGPSDHQSFYRQKVPVLFFFTGLHNDYHRPSDDSDKINFTGLARITDITCEVATLLATRPDRLAYAETVREVEIRWQATAYLGVQLREIAEQQGVLVTGVTPGNAAEAAGILVGDQILKIDEREVKTPGEVLETIRSRDAGDPIKVHFLRANQLMSVIAILKNRPH